MVAGRGFLSQSQAQEIYEFFVRLKERKTERRDLIKGLGRQTSAPRIRKKENNTKNDNGNLNEIKSE